MTTGIDKEKLSQRIKGLRKKHNLNQAQLAKSAGVTAAAVCQIEGMDRVPTIPVLHRLATVLKVSMDYLAGRQDESEIEDLLQDEEVHKFFRGYQKLTGEDKRMIEAQIEFLNQKRKNE